MLEFGEHDAAQLEAVQARLDAAFANLETATRAFDASVAALWRADVEPLLSAYNAVRAEMFTELTAWEERFAEAWSGLSDRAQEGGVGETLSAFERGFGAAALGYREPMEVDAPEATKLDDNPDSFRNLMEDGF